MPRRVGDFRGLSQPNRLRLMRAIQRRPGIRADELAEECGIPLNTTRDHLRVLEDEGLISGERIRTGTRGRPPVGYRAVGAATSTDAARARVEAAQRQGAVLRRMTSGAAEVADEPAQAQLDVLWQHLDDSGLEPVVDAPGLSIDLAPCRFHDLIDGDAGLVCAVHARLVGDVLAQVDGPLALKRVEPFVTPHRCVVSLTLRTRSA
ncbi:MAG: helix-turn-helix domain-containing protein [Actinobacteria bacterium]|nr:helix-turn-helix domain-containing protein [Actinomycetota bacterium]